jgi:peptidoglycan-associated lipoprotein
MKKSYILALVALMFAFSGCSQKEPEVVEEPVVKIEEKVPSASEEMIDTKAKAEQEAKAKEEAMLRAVQMLNSKLTKIYFDFDKHEVKSSEVSKVEDGASVANEEAFKDLNIKVEGNCDEWGTDEYNYALGLKRAKSVKNALVANGVDASRLNVVSFGESNPACTKSNKECWMENRRVEFKVLP